MKRSERGDQPNVSRKREEIDSPKSSNLPRKPFEHANDTPAQERLREIGQAGKEGFPGELLTLMGKDGLRDEGCCEAEEGFGRGLAVSVRSHRAVGQ